MTVCAYGCADLLTGDPTPVQLANPDAPDDGYYCPDCWEPALSPTGCTCVYSCADHPPTACPLSGDWHVHPNSYPGDVFGPCPVHPDAPGDL